MPLIERKLFHTPCEGVGLEPAPYSSTGLRVNPTQSDRIAAGNWAEPGFCLPGRGREGQTALTLRGSMCRPVEFTL